MRQPSRVSTAPEPVSVWAPGYSGPTMMTQSWRDAGFLHWAVDPRDVAPMLPRGVHPDVIDGVTYVGLVPFRMVGAGAARWGLHEDHAGVTWYVPNIHEPWPLRRAELLACDDELVGAAGFGALVGRAPDLVHYSPGVSVRFGFPRPALR